MSSRKGHWLFNHGTQGPRPVFQDGTHRPTWSWDPREITGINVLFGDGSARWRDGSEMPLQGMHDDPDSVRHVDYNHFY
jgi:prepilin-type processing-associated H-X9-DG protein